jgi:hypothetical protein
MNHLHLNLKRTHHAVCLLWGDCLSAAGYVSVCDAFLTAYLRPKAGKDRTCRSFGVKVRQRQCCRATLGNDLTGKEDGYFLAWPGPYSTTKSQQRLDTDIFIAVGKQSAEVSRIPVEHAEKPRGIGSRDRVFGTQSRVELIAFDVGPAGQQCQSRSMGRERLRAVEPIQKLLLKVGILIASEGTHGSGTITVGSLRSLDNEMTDRGFDRPSDGVRTQPGKVYENCIDPGGY